MDVILDVTGARLLARCCLILGDRLTNLQGSLKFFEPENFGVMQEVWSKGTYVKHNEQKIASIFSMKRLICVIMSPRMVVTLGYYRRIGCYEPGRQNN